MGTESYMVRAARDWAERLEDQRTELPEGLYNLGVHASLQMPHIRDDSRYIFHWSSYEYDFTFESEFDATTKPTGGEIRLFNLRDETIAQIRPGLLAAVTGGYGMGQKSDQGRWLYGWVLGTDVKWRGPDKEVCIRVVNLDSGSPVGLQNPDRAEQGYGYGGTRVSLSYAAPVKAGFILQQLCEMSGLPVAEFALVRDRQFTESVTVEGCLNERIAEFAAICGVWAYPVNGMLYVKDMRRDPGRNCFLLSESTGLLGSPELWSEKRRDGRAGAEEASPDVYTGYKVRCLLNHRMMPGMGVELWSKNAQGRYTVKHCKHVYDGVGGTTEMVLMG